MIVNAPNVAPDTLVKEKDPTLKDADTSAPTLTKEGRVRVDVEGDVRTLGGVKAVYSADQEVRRLAELGQINTAVASQQAMLQTECSTSHRQGFEAR